MNRDDDGGFLARWARRKAGVRSGESVKAPAVAGRAGAAAVAPAIAPATAPASAPTNAPETAVTSPSATASAALPGVDGTTGAVPSLARPAPPLPTLADVAGLTRTSDYSRFMASGVTSSVRNAAMKKLFADPHFNVMDGLDTYIDDYGKSDPIPLAMLRQMNQSKALGLFDHEDEEAAAAAKAGAPALGASALGAPALGARPAADPLESFAATDAPPAALAPADAATPVASSAAFDAAAALAAGAPRIAPDDDADLRLQPDDEARWRGPAPGPRA